MKKTGLLALALLAALLLGGCAGGKTVTLRVICESEDVYSIFYSTYLDGTYFSAGGMADLDGRALTEESDLALVFPEGYFEDGDLSAFSITFSPYGKDDLSEIATTAPLAFPIAYGESYTIRFSGSREDGFTARLVPPDGAP